MESLSDEPFFSVDNIFFKLYICIEPFRDIWNNGNVGLIDPDEWRVYFRLHCSMFIID